MSELNQLLLLAALAAANGGGNNGGTRTAKMKMRDSFRSTNITDDGTVVRCVKDGFRCTNVSQQLFSTHEGPSILCKVKVHKRMGGVVSMGIVGERVVDNNSDRLAGHCCGEREIDPSLGCAIADGDVHIIHQDRTLFSGSCDTRDPTVISMYIDGGKLRFWIDNREVDSDKLKSLRINGNFHLGVSCTKAGQVVEVKETVVGGDPPKNESGGGGALNGLLNALQNAVTSASTPVWIAPNERGENVPPGMVTWPLRPNGGFRWMMPSFANARRQELTVTSNSSGSVVFTEQLVKAGTCRGIMCDHCYHGKGEEKFCSNRFKCTLCNDFDLCGDCFYNSQVKHQHERSAFKVALAGAGFQCNAVLNLNGNRAFVAVVPRGKEADFRHGIDSEYQLAAANGETHVSISLAKEKAVFSINGRIAHSCDVTDDIEGFRFAVRFTASGQSATMKRRGVLPAPGAVVSVSSDRELLERAYGLTCVNYKSEYLGRVGRVSVLDGDGTARVVGDFGSMWVPLSCLTVQAPPPPPSYRALKAGDRVVPNPGHWIFKDQSGGGVGEVVADRDEDGWVRVKWGEGGTNIYRAGVADYAGITRFDVVRMPSRGDNVVRNPRFWDDGNDDGGEGNTGVVLTQDGGHMEIKWHATGKITKHKFNRSTHAVEFADPPSNYGSSNKNTSAAATTNNNGLPSQQQSPVKTTTTATSTVFTPTPPLTTATTTTNQQASPTHSQTASPATPPGPIFQARLCEIQEYETNLSTIRGIGHAPDMALVDAMALDDELCHADLSSEALMAQMHMDNVKAANNGLIPHNVTHEEGMALNLYTQDTAFYVAVGHRLRVPQRQKLQPLFPVLKLLFGALKKLPKVSLKVYRGVREDLHGQYPKGKKIAWWSLTSTTSSVNVMETDAFAGQDGSRTVFHITAHDLVSVRDFTYNVEEDEYILMPGSVLEVVSVANMGHGLHIIELAQMTMPAGATIDFFK